jgi:hypothetical protein
MTACNHGCAFGQPNAKNNQMCNCATRSQKLPVLHYKAWKGKYMHCKMAFLRYSALLGTYIPKIP